MNKERRKEIRRITEEIESLEMELQNVADEEQEAFDNLPENFQEGERGDKMTECIDALEEAISDLGTVRENIEI